MRLGFTQVLAVLLLAIGTPCHGYYADEQSTETLWKLSPADRIAAEEARHVRENFLKRMKLFLVDNANVTTGGTVFLGASIIEGFPCEEAFGTTTPEGKRTVANRGIGGDDIENMLTRLDICVRDLQPKKLIVQVGTNDIWWVQRDYKEGNLGAGFERLVRRVRELSPETQIELTTILPINTWNLSEKDLTRYRTWVTRANEQMKQVGKKLGVRVYDINSVVSNGTGRMVSRYSTDGVHLTLLGYLQWIDETIPAGPERMKVWSNLSRKWAAQYPKHIRLNGTNKTRNDNELILFKREGGTSVTTGTNLYGAEVTVIDDRVTNAKRAGDMPIPPNGYVLSGNGAAAAWLLHYAPVGARIYKTGDTFVAEPAPEKMDAALYYEHARGEFLHAMAAGKTDLNQYADRLEKARKGDEKLGKTLLKELKELNKSLSSPK